MNGRRTGLILFWGGALYLFVATWLIMWWVAPFWHNTPAEQLDGPSPAVSILEPEDMFSG